MGADGVDVRLVVPSPAAAAPGTTPVTGHPSSATPGTSLLPRTGADVLVLLLLAVVLVAAGALLVTRTSRETS